MRVPADTAASHAGVHLEMERLAPASRDLGVVEHRPEVVPAIDVRLIAASRREHYNGTSDTGVSQLDPLLQRGDPVPPRIELLERPRHRYGAEAVAVRLHHGQQGGSSYRRHRAGVGNHVCEVDLDPRARRGTSR